MTSMGSVRWDGCDLYYEEAGDGTPILLIHPAGSTASTFPGQKRNDMVLWVESHHAVVAGDTLADFGDGPQINQDVTREQVVEGLSPLLALPVEHMLATHGGPFDRAALERALS